MPFVTPVRAIRRTPERAPSLLAAALALVALAIAPRTAAAQGSSIEAKLSLVGIAQPCLNTGVLVGAHDVGTDCRTPSVRPQWPCPDIGPGRPQTCHIYEEPWAGMDSVWGRVRASNTAGQLRVNSDLVVQTALRPLSTPGAAGGYKANAYASWSDELDLGTTPRDGDIWVAFDLFVHGYQGIRVGSTGVNGLTYNTSQRYTFNFDMNTADGRSSDWFGQNQLRSLGPDEAQRVQSDTLDSSTTVWRKVGQNDRLLGFTYNFRSEAEVPSSVQAGTQEDYYVWSRVTGDFGSTAGLTGVRFYDASRSTELTNVGYSFVNGTQFVTTTTTAPEPATWALMGTGLVALAGIARRRREGAAN